MRTSIEFWTATTDRYNQPFTYKGVPFIYCSYAEGLGKEIIGHIVWNKETEKHELWQGRKRDRIIEVNP